MQTKEQQIITLSMEMIQYYQGDPRRIQHFLKVHSLARLIGQEEKLDGETQFILEAAALVHDIGIKQAEKKYGKCGGKLQEQEGPSEASKMLKRLGFEAKIIERVCYLVGRHHTYDDISGEDYQILVEADFLVNFYEDQTNPAAIKAVYDRIFVTETGKSLCRILYGEGGQAE